MDPSKWRISKACEDCRARKIRCDGQLPCSRCKMRGLDCVYRDKPRNRQRASQQRPVRTLSPAVSDTPVSSRPSDTSASVTATYQSRSPSDVVPESADADRLGREINVQSVA